MLIRFESDKKHRYDFWSIIDDHDQIKDIFDALRDSSRIGMANQSEDQTLEWLRK